MFQKQPLNMSQHDANEVFRDPLPAAHCAKSNGNGSSSYEVVSAAAPGLQFHSPPIFNTDTGFDPARQHYSQDDLINDNFPTESCPTPAQVSNGNTMDSRPNRKCDSLNFLRRKRKASELISIDEGTENTDKPVANRYSLIRIVHICVILVFAAISVMSLVFAMKVQQQIEDLQTKYDSLHTFQAQTEREPNVCLPCIEVERGPSPEDTPELKDLLKRVENGQEMCCIKTRAQYALLLNLFWQRKHLEKCAREVLQNENQQPTSCNNTTSNDSISLPPTQPLYGNVSAHLQAGSQLGNLVIPSTGRYFLYSQVGFLIYYKDGVTKQEPRSLFHFVYRRNHLYATDQQLLRSDLTQCWGEDKDYGRYTSYVGASVMLNKGDNIYVKVTQIELLSRGERSLTYFGLFKMG
ncbi:TNFL6-like protein [Mya arenaria]|uniref:TNFL6-like protein n=1 Tax=Mya arenaria TaxID=6604 RepID=A0ABY7FVN8_MYAAR|nr:TNFL6-like protein [Mya arenaria]